VKKTHEFKQKNDEMDDSDDSDYIPDHKKPGFIEENIVINEKSKRVLRSHAKHKQEISVADKKELSHSESNKITDLQSNSEEIESSIKSEEDIKFENVENTEDYDHCELVQRYLKKRVFIAAKGGILQYSRKHGKQKFKFINIESLGSEIPRNIVLADRETKLLYINPAHRNRVEMFDLHTKEINNIIDIDVGIVSF
jgi:hypothetical protein